MSDKELAEKVNEINENLNKNLNQNEKPQKINEPKLDENKKEKLKDNNQINEKKEKPIIEDQKDKKDKKIKAQKKPQQNKKSAVIFLFIVGILGLLIGAGLAKIYNSKVMKKKKAKAKNGNDTLIDYDEDDDEDPMKKIELYDKVNEGKVLDQLAEREKERKKIINETKLKQLNNSTKKNNSHFLNDKIIYICILIGLLLIE